MKSQIGLPKSIKNIDDAYVQGFADAEEAAARDLASSNTLISDLIEERETLRTALRALRDATAKQWLDHRQGYTDEDTLIALGVAMGNADMLLKDVAPTEQYTLKDLMDDLLFRAMRDGGVGAPLERLQFPKRA